jgi:hypothetical protein
MSVKRFLTFIIVLSPWTVGAFPDRAWADVQAVLACRQLPPGPGRADCLERASADLARERSAPAKPLPSSAGPFIQRSGPPEFRSRSQAPAKFAARVQAISYKDGRPIFDLDNGQTWYSLDRRHLTFKRGRSYATIEKTPVGMLLHYNGSFFALQVVEKNS